MTSRVAPLIRHDGTDKGWRVCDEGAALLREIHEPVVVIAVHTQTHTHTDAHTHTHT
jgi:hypothetical protein